MDVFPRVDAVRQAIILRGNGAERHHPERVFRSPMSGIGANEPLSRMRRSGIRVFAELFLCGIDSRRVSRCSPHPSAFAQATTWLARITDNAQR